MQPELLFYALFFLTFLAACGSLAARTPRARVPAAWLTGLLAGVAYLTKAVVPPFLAWLAAVHVFRGVVRARAEARPFAALGRAALGVIGMFALFALVIAPYAIHSKQVFGEYLFNHNTNYYIWFDDGAEARATMLPATDVEGRLAIDPARLPSAASYWRTHSVAAIWQRIAAGWRSEASATYGMYGLVKYVALYGVLAAILALARPRAAGAVILRHGWLLLFFAGYAAIYLPAIAFFDITSGTGSTRFLLAHAAPLCFVLAAWCDAAGFREARARVGAFRIPLVAAGAWLFTALAALDVLFWVAPRLAATYGGF